MTDVLGAGPPPPIERHWNFVADTVPLWRRRQVFEALLRRGIRAPGFIALKEITAAPAWILYFIYSPSGSLGPLHRYTLSRLRDDGNKVIVVIATADRTNPSEELYRYVDALYWKALPGYDFSAYALGLRALATRSPGATVLVMNDSVFGPLTSLRPALADPPWQLTGYTASGKIENHVQSYAFIVRHVTRQLLAHLHTVLFPFIACRDRDDVIDCQETRFARVASRHMSVGAYVYMREHDPTQAAPFELIAGGHPFLKKSLVEARSAYADKDRVRGFIDDALQAAGMPPETS